MLSAAGVKSILSRLRRVTVCPAASDTFPTVSAPADFSGSVSSVIYSAFPRIGSKSVSEKAMGVFFTPHFFTSTLDFMTDKAGERS